MVVVSHHSFRVPGSILSQVIGVSHVLPVFDSGLFGFLLPPENSRGIGYDKLPKVLMCIYIVPCNGLVSYPGYITALFQVYIPGIGSGCTPDLIR